MLSFLSWSKSVAGLQNGQLKPCPASPNCVCSGKGAAISDPVHAIAPLNFQGTPAEAWERLAAVLQAYPRTKVVTRTETYLHAECSTPVLRFVDDVEFLLVPNRQLIQVRSASRIGYSDLGANRKRVDELRRRFEAAAPQ
ncbi:MAG: DUF1499 domain-containing protein [Planctomyces sp.]|nr:DUF1499 domain-containing protein [Planctomyces sp.]